MLLLLLLLLSSLLLFSFYYCYVCCTLLIYFFVYIPPPPIPSHTHTHIHTHTHTHTLISTHTNHVGWHVCFIYFGYFVFDLSPVNSMFVCIIIKKIKIKIKKNLQYSIIFFWTLPQMCGLMQSCLWATQAICLTSGLIFCSDMHFQLLDLLLRHVCRVVTVWDFHGMIIVSENITVSRYHGIRY